MIDVAGDQLVPAWLQRLAAIGWRVLATLLVGAVFAIRIVIGQQPRAGHVEIDDAVAVQGTRPDEASDRRLYPKADKLHGLLQLSA